MQTFLVSYKTSEKAKGNPMPSLFFMQDTENFMVLAKGCKSIILQFLEQINLSGD